MATGSSAAVGIKPFDVKNIAIWELLLNLRFW